MERRGNYSKRRGNYFKMIIKHHCPKPPSLQSVVSTEFLNGFPFL